MLRSILSILVLTLLIVACNTTTDKDIYDLAQQKYTDENYPETLQEYERLIKEFPETQYRAKALFEIGKLYHGEVVKSLTKEQNLNKGINYYKKVYNEFPDSAYAPNSLFMIGFILANELQELDSARFYYNKFIASYPDNEMVLSAKAEIENLGVSAEEILKRKDIQE